MNNIKIIYDTMNDLPENIDGKYDIDMLPTTIIFQGKEYKAGVDIDNDEFYKLLRDNKEIPTTSQVTYMTFKETFEKYVKEGKKVLYMAGSSKGSGTYQSAMLAKNDIESDDIYIFDTYSLCIGGGLLVLEAAKMVEEGFYYSAGKVRSVPVAIGGTTWKPELPIESVIKEELEKIFNDKMDDIDRAIELILYTMKKQIFIDGNKRTAVIFSNHYLSSKGKGIIAIPAELAEEFKNLLIPYYEGKDEKKIKKFIKEKCYINI